MPELSNTIQQSGFDFPTVRNTPWGPLSYVTNDTLTLIESSIKQILLTAPGERPWNPEFGCPLKLMLFETPSDTMRETLQTMIYEALVRWEPRIIVSPDGITVSVSNDNAATVNILVNFKIKSPLPTSDQSLSISL